MGTVAVWDINGREEMGRLNDVHTQEVSAMALSECGNKLFTAGGSDDPTIKEWDLRTMRKVKNVGYHKDRVLALAVLTKPEQSYVFSAGKDNTVGITLVAKTGVVKSKVRTPAPRFTP